MRNIFIIAFFMLFAPTLAAAQETSAAAPDPYTSLLPLLFIFVIFYFLLIRPQQKKMKDHREMLGQLKRGDRVVTAGGIVATITKVKDGSDEIEAEIAPNVKVTVVRGTIGSVLRPEAANDEAKS
jgi:preprotein translocase subunit YajC